MVSKSSVKLSRGLTYYFASQYLKPMDLHQHHTSKLVCLDSC